MFRSVPVRPRLYRVRYNLTNKLPFVSLSFGEMLAFTLTAFLELMDHGIVSWDLISLSFIKQVPPSLMFYSTDLHCSKLQGLFISLYYHMFLFYLSLPETSGLCCLATPHIMQ